MKYYNKEWHRQYYKKNKAKIQKYQKEYRKKNKAKIQKYKKEYRKKNKAKIIISSCKYYDANAEKLILKSKNNYKDNKDKIKKQMLEYIHNHPEKNKIRTRTHRAVKNGLLLKKPCQKCGYLKVEAHHINYKDHLKIVWLCTKHHKLLHKRENRKRKISKIKD